MAKQNEFPSAMNDTGMPTEMSPAKDLTNTETNTPIVEVNQPWESQDLLEIRNPLR